MTNQLTPNLETKNGRAVSRHDERARQSIYARHTFRDLENAFLDINYCSLCSFYPIVTKPKSTENRAYVLVSVLGFEKLLLAVMVKKGNRSKVGCNLRHYLISRQDKTNRDR
jgi:hypothetical protein